MGRLIDAEILAKKVKSLRMILVGGPRSGKGFFAECMKQYLESVLRIIDEQPTVDAVPVVHGKWYWDEDWHCKCSVCGNFAVVKRIVLKTNYCSNCGAKMDLKGEEG